MCCNNLKEEGSADSGVAADMLQHGEEEEEKDNHNKHLARLSLCHINITLSHQKKVGSMTFLQKFSSFNRI
jgi:hypothetical protein